METYIYITPKNELKKGSWTHKHRNQLELFGSHIFSDSVCLLVAKRDTAALIHGILDHAGVRNGSDSFERSWCGALMGSVNCMQQAACWSFGGEHGLQS